MLQFTDDGLKRIKEIGSLLGESKTFEMEPTIFLILQISYVVQPDSERRIFLGGKHQSSMRSEEESEG